jgi:dipeptidyl aminopeptidase/acylaminoacyl peptidase
LVDLYFEATTDVTKLIEVAPIYHLSDITAPIQIHIGTEDGKQMGYTPPEWSEKLYNALRNAGKQVDYFSYAGQEHFFTGESWTLMMQRALAFFDERL